MRKNFTLIVLCVIVCACLMLPVSYIDKVNASENDTITLRYENKEWLYQDVFDNKNFANLFTMQERNVEWQNGKAKERIISYISEGQSVEEALSHYFPRFDAFYENIRCEIEQEYNANGLFIAALGIHESNWGTSTISVQKKNLFGYGAYDSNPYNGAYTFDNYAESIDLVSRVFVKYYLNPKNATIYDGQVANGSYYNGNTLSAVNKKYATDKNWANSVYNWMTYLYNRL